VRDKRDVEYLYITRYDLNKRSVVKYYLFFPPSYTTLIYISANEAQIIVNQKFANNIKFVFGKTGWVIPDLFRCEE
jgi:hypothetical protein